MERKPLRICRNIEGDTAFSYDGMKIVIYDNPTVGENNQIVYEWSTSIDDSEEKGRSYIFFGNRDHPVLDDMRMRERIALDLVRIRLRALSYRSDSPTSFPTTLSSVRPAA